MSTIESRGYVTPEVLVSTDWVTEHLQDKNIRIVESNEDPLLYSSGHVPGAVEIDWAKDLNDPLVRDYLQPAQFRELVSKNGITPEMTVVFYGDKNNWWATYAFWLFELYGHKNLKIMDGGRLKWEKDGKAFTREVPKYQTTDYPTKQRDDKTNRAFRDDVLAHLTKNGKLVDVRSPEEYRGERLHMPDYPNEGALRGGHIPGAKSIPWARAVDTTDGTFKPATQLKELYERDNGLSPKEDIIAYCRIGERSSHSWFVLKYLLGYENIRNYDGSWTEWGNLVGVPVEKP
jgi:thiosulfate/3-mercaptopyruvate sulfurtransferase